MIFNPSLIRLNAGKRSVPLVVSPDRSTTHGTLIITHDYHQVQDPKRCWYHNTYPTITQPRTSHHSLDGPAETQQRECPAFHKQRLWPWQGMRRTAVPWVPLIWQRRRTRKIIIIVPPASKTMTNLATILLMAPSSGPEGGQTRHHHQQLVLSLPLPSPPLSDTTTCGAIGHWYYCCC